MPFVQVAGHFGEWLQGRLGPQGSVVLLTMPCDKVGVTGWHRSGGLGLRVAGAGMALPVVRRFLDDLGPGLQGRVRLRSKVAQGLGTGVSTARLVALARLAGWNGPAEALARACVACEGASDPLMFDAPERLLWASRSGLAVMQMPALPRYEVLGGFWGGPRPTDPRDSAFPDIIDLVADWAQASDLAGFAALASESAARTLRLRGPVSDPTAALARDLGALGWAMAHTGAARALIFAPGQVPPHARAAVQAAGLRGLVQWRGGGLP